MNAEFRGDEEQVSIPAGKVTLDGDLVLAPSARGIVVFAHGSGSSRKSPRNRYVAQELQRAGLATLLFDLLTSSEELVDERTAELRFNIPFLAERLAGATGWLLEQEKAPGLRIGYFGASTGAGAALVAAAQRPKEIGAVVSRGGRPDLAAELLPQVQAPTLLIVGGRDTPVVGMNRDALAKLQSEKELTIVPGASHLFEEPGALEQVSRLARDWFVRYLGAKRDERVA